MIADSFNVFIYANQSSITTLDLLRESIEEREVKDFVGTLVRKTTDGNLKSIFIVSIWMYIQCEASRGQCLLMCPVESLRIQYTCGRISDGGAADLQST